MSAGRFVEDSYLMIVYEIHLCFKAAFRSILSSPVSVISCEMKFLPYWLTFFHEALAN